MTARQAGRSLRERRHHVLARPWLAGDARGRTAPPRAAPAGVAQHPSHPAARGRSSAPAGAGTPGQECARGPVSFAAHWRGPSRPHSGAREAAAVCMLPEDAGTDDSSARRGRAGNAQEASGDPGRGRAHGARTHAGRSVSARLGGGRTRRRGSGASLSRGFALPRGLSPVGPVTGHRRTLAPCPSGGSSPAPGPAPTDPRLRQPGPPPGPSGGPRAPACWTRGAPSVR